MLFGIWNLGLGIRNPGKQTFWNPKSTEVESETSTWEVELTWNPESKTVMHYIWGDLADIYFGVGLVCLHREANFQM